MRARIHGSVDSALQPRMDLHKAVADFDVLCIPCRAVDKLQELVKLPGVELEDDQLFRDVGLEQEVVESSDRLHKVDKELTLLDRQVNEVLGGGCHTTG